MKKIIAIVLLICMSINIFAQTYHAQIHFVHGMNGTGQSLHRLKTEMKSWQESERLYPLSINTPVTYDSPNGILKSAITVGEDLNTPEYWAAKNELL